MAAMILSAGLCITTRKKFREYLVHVNESNLHLRCYTFIANSFFSLRSYLTKNTIYIWRTKDLNVGRSSCTLPAIFIRYSTKPKLLDAFVKLRKATVSFAMSVFQSIQFVRPSARMEKLGSQRKDFHEIWYLRIFQKSTEKIQVWLKSYKNNSYFK